MTKIAILMTKSLTFALVLLGISISYPALSEETHASQRGFQDPLICLDPGHPSELNDGRTVQNGLTELHINWMVATELASILSDSGFEVILTSSTEDEFVSNEDRAEIANSNNADLFFRIHCDSGPVSASGMTFYYPDRQGTWDGHSGPPEEIIPFCRDAAVTIHDSVIEKLDGLLRDRGVRTDNETAVGKLQGGALRGSILSEVPVVLVELCFLSNPDDAEIISSDETRSRIVEALADGIIDVFGSSDSS